MRSDQLESGGSRPPSAIGGGRLIDRLGPVGRWIRGRRAAPWRVAALAVAASLAAAGSVAVFSPQSDRVEWLDGGRQFAPDEVEAMASALAIKGIAARADDWGRIGVEPARLAEAQKVLEQQGLGRKPLIQELDDPDRPSLLDDSASRADVFLRAEARKVERALDGVPGIGSAVVVLKPKPGRPAFAFAKPEVAGAGVRLRAEPGRTISPMTVERVLNVVTTFTQLDPEAVTIIDAQGDALLRAGDRGHALSMRAEARARAWEAAIAEELSRVVDGARVEVRLEGPPIGDRGAEAPEAGSAAVSQGVVAVVPNGPMSLDRPPAAARGAGTVEPGAGSSSGPGPGSGEDAIPGRANVLVEVPASYYLARHEAFADGEEPGREILDRFVAFTEEYVRSIVAHVIPEESLGRLQVLMLPLSNDEAGLAEERGPAGRRGWAGPWWAPAAVVGGGAALALLAAAGGWLPGFRPAPRAPAEPGAPRPHLMPSLRDDDTPGPADRVRELVRRDPSAAAAVLRRWVDQGVDA
ncbi:hypothetical protein [Tautonia sociabilis]|nr:hypothetical protein [Tautonia sociabilis]